MKDRKKRCEADFLNALNEKNSLPKTIIYSLNPNDDEADTGDIQSSVVVISNKKIVLNLCKK
jgi:uronate isomerase 1